MSLDTMHVAGATSKIVRVKAITISTGLPYTAGAFNTASISATYTRDGAAAVTITLVTATAGTYTSSGFVHAGKGVYEIGAPTAALAAGADGVIFAVDGISDVLFSTTRVELVGTDPRSSSAVSANVTQIAGQTANAAAAVTFPATLASTTNITSAAGCLISSGTGAGQLDVTSGVIKANLAQILGTALTETAGQIANGFKQFFNIASPTSTMNTITAVTTTTTATNLTNAPTSGDLTATMKTSVKTQITDALAVDTYAEAASVPAATSTLKDKINWMFMKSRNKITQTATTQLVRNDADAATVGTSTVSDDGTTNTRGKFA